MKEISEMQTKKYVCAGLLAHVDAGKTTLSEGILYTAGRLRHLGRVDNGDAFLDTYDLEKERGITIFSKQAVLQMDDTFVTLLDTPGHVDFSAEMERTLQVLDYAILVISGADGVQGHTETLWKLLQQYEIPTFLFINKMDQPGTDRDQLMEELRTRLGSGCVDFTDETSEGFMEEIALCGEELLEAFLGQGSVDLTCITGLVRERKVFPCFFGSALKLEGVEQFLKGFQKYTEPAIYRGDFGARVFKIVRDEAGNRLTYVKVTGGVLRARMEIEDARGTWREKVHQIRIYSGSRYETVNEATAGMICALTGLSRTCPGEGLGSEAGGKKPVLEPVLTYQIRLPEGTDAAVMLPKLRLLEEEEPELHIVWKEELQEIQAQVMGEVQIEILQHLIEERYGVRVTFGTGNIVYKETIATAVEGVGHFEPLRHYAEVHLWLEPGEPGSGFQADTECSEDELDKNWQRLVLTHLREREHPGVLTGAAVTDIRVTLIAGRAHLKHTEGGDFRQAAYRAVRQGLMRAESVLLEPYYDFRLEVPEASVGRAMTDIERMAGTFTLESASGLAVLTGSAPVITMRDYLREVTAYTKGQGRLFCRPSGYRPCHNADEVIMAKGYDPDRDAENPTGSVFCAHGAGFNVPWNEVRDYMHMDTAAEKVRRLPGDGTCLDEDERLVRREEEWIDTEEIDRILERTSHANRKSGPVSHKGISAKRVRSVAAKPAELSKPAKKPDKKDSFLLVDGYNVIFAWEELRDLSKISIDAARGRLQDILCNYQGFKQCRLILVFDAYRVQNHRTEVFPYHNITVVYTKEAETADQYIEKFAHENARRYHVTVATSDGLEQIIIRGEGCRLLSARDLEEEIRHAGAQMKEYINE